MAPRLAVTPGRPRPLERKPWRSQELPRRTGSTGGGCDRCTSVPPAPSPQPRSRRPSWTQRELLLSRPPPGLAADHSPGTPVALSPQMAWEVAPSRMTVLAPWDPNYKAKAGPRLVWGPSCAPGTSFSGRTLCHPSLWPLYEAASGRDLRSLAPATGHQNGEHEPRDADPLLPCGQRIPLHLSEASQQVSDGLSEAAAPTSYHVSLGPPHPIPWLPYCLAQWA
ncbi:histone deacetylase complex subunit SAP25 isoform X7 [Prionailurus iriomotensis]